MQVSSIGMTVLVLCPTYVFAAAMERSDQSIAAFLEKNNYFELSVAKLEAQVSGQVPKHEQLTQLQVHDFSTGNLVNDYLFSNIAIKLQPHPKYSIGLIYDQPLGIDLAYDYSPNSLQGRKTIESAKLKFESQNLTMLTGFQPNQNWNIYTGLSHQTLKGRIKLYGLSYSFLSGYDAEIEEDSALGWLAGVSYQIPEIALKTSLTYRSAIQHHTQINETLSNQALTFTPNASTTIQAPQSLNLDFNIALNQNNLAYSSIRWVNWKAYQIQPTQFAAIINEAARQYPDLIQQFNLIDYQDNQISGKLGLAHRISERWISTSDISWDSGSGNPATTLNPSNGFWGFGLGVLYNLKTDSYIAFGLKYFRLNQAKVSNSAQPITGNQISPLTHVQQNNAIAYGLRIAHHF
ncbi:outer membrane protein transport protein [Acinetobacter sp. ANC 4648]|uniref:outer membrane protein transport protein n=1 Tax=Acinetobacter sp. ANC 4648 TaxID=1977875 RepID=UPI000A33681C|nr:outer membrane protein transport protein [Acinetobacter sp. ANC 4648]OTG81594.1 transport of long-chain fatty acid [Acinetobacter sp. ANC 4648]